MRGVLSQVCISRRKDTLTVTAACVAVATADLLCFSAALQPRRGSLCKYVCRIVAIKQSRRKRPKEADRERSWKRDKERLKILSCRYRIHRMTAALGAVSAVPLIFFNHPEIACTSTSNNSSTAISGIALPCRVSSLFSRPTIQSLAG